MIIQSLIKFVIAAFLLIQMAAYAHQQASAKKTFAPVAELAQGKGR